jgi:16S rRNA processing protein RimM
VAGTRWHSGQLLVRFAGIDDRDAAAELGGIWLYVDSATIAPSDDPDEFHDTDLIGLSVRTVAGTLVGSVADVFHHGQDMLAVSPVEPGKAEILVPFVKSIVSEVDVASGYLVIDPPEGLLDLTDPL